MVHIHFWKLYLSKKLHNAICLGALVFMKACVKQTLCAQICTPNIWISTTMLLPSFYTSSLGKQIMLQQIFCSTSRLNKRLHSADVCWFCTFSIRWKNYLSIPTWNAWKLRVNLSHTKRLNAKVVWLAPVLTKIKSYLLMLKYRLKKSFVYSYLKWLKIESKSKP